MPMQTFTFPYHVQEVRWPQSSTTIQFGKGYQFVSKPTAPDQLVFALHFEAMKYYLNTNSTINRTIYPETNLARLEDFYEAHRLYEKFIYPSPTKGNVVVRFSSPLTIKPMPAGGGACEPFTLELTLQP